ncbi:Major surface antigen 4 precursor [Anaplasma phagocytophilum]|nr:Major surface antigen 4 precursor [Anaplasma phagocytophilum]SBO33464.1 Major surface antigen 4 precursor [Anaplasma phagocytophilum]SBO33741.1 Major surface antigen 4 precursor [Anaplasma phagocytophilum]
MGLDYSPTFVNIKNFSIGKSDGETKGVYPYLKDGETVKLYANRFDWETPNPQIRFYDNMFVAMGGSAGYAMGNTRIEVEVGYERFKKKSRKDKGDAVDYADTVYLLAKELAYDVVTDQTNKLAAALAKVSGKDMVYFANSLKSEHPIIDARICKGETSNGGKGLQEGDTKAGNCDTGVLVRDKSTEDKTKYKEYAGPFGLVSSLGDRGVEKWPNINNHYLGKQYSSKGLKWTNETTKVVSDDGKYSYQRDASDTVANDIIKLNSEAREIVAQFLMKTIEGAEVIEIKGISSTSFIVNVCSDIVAEDFVAVPYACLGLGGNLIEFVEGCSDLRPAYKLKVGLSYQLSQNVNAFADIFYHRVLGNREYSDLPIRHLIRDRSPAGRSKNATTANFSMKYTGAELGIQLRF